MTSRLISILLLVFACFCSFSQKGVLKIQITYTEPYCGGARPTKEIEEEANRARPYAGKKIVIVSESGKVRCVKTNEQGFINIKLKPGSYSLFEKWRHNRQVPEGYKISDVDPECIKLEWKKEIARVKVISAGSTVDQNNAVAGYCPWSTPCLIDSVRPPQPQ